MRVPPRALVGFACVALLLGVGLVVIGILRTRPTGTAAAAAPGDTAETTKQAAPTCGPWGCEQEKRFEAAAAFIKKQPGYLSIIVRDRETGEVWKSGKTTHVTWTASTIKLAMATSLLERDRAGEITLDARARKEIADMLAFSSNDGADYLWSHYGRADFIPRFQQKYGMKHLTFVDGYSRYWGLMKCNTEDLAALMSYILDKLDSTDRKYLVKAMRNVDPIQQWGVMAAGEDLHPGAKDGWSLEDEPNGKRYVEHTVGFAGDDERYVVAAMYHLTQSNGTQAKGVHVISDLIATVFGQPVPAPAVVPDRD